MGISGDSLFCLPQDSVCTTGSQLQFHVSASPRKLDKKLIPWSQSRCTEPESLGVQSRQWVFKTVRKSQYVWDSREHPTTPNWINFVNNLLKTYCVPPLYPHFASVWGSQGWTCLGSNFLGSVSLQQKFEVMDGPVL